MAGALSFDVTRSSSIFDDGHEENGLSYRLNYSKRIDATNSQISLAAYRFSEREFHSYANFIAHQYNNTDTQDEKQTISISFNQPIDPLRMNLYISALRQQWWMAIAPRQHRLPPDLILILATGKAYRYRHLSVQRNMKKAITTTGLSFTFCPFRPWSTVELRHA